jgi:xanthine/uracil permease
MNNKAAGKAVVSLILIGITGWVMSAFAFVMQVQIIQALWWEQVPDLTMWTALLFSAVLIFWLVIMKVFWQKVIVSLASWVAKR